MTGVGARNRYHAKRKAKRRVGYATEADFLAARDGFLRAARAQRCCQHPDCPNPRAFWRAHHVVYEQELRRLGRPIYDERNALRMCDHCHGRHHGISPLPLTALKPCHFEYAKEVLGDSYMDYLNRRYLTECPI